MVLAGMLHTDRDAVICDLAETYHIYDLKALPLRTVATLAAGLGDNSRIKLKLRNQRVALDTELLAVIADKLSLMVWQNSKDGHKGVNMPKSILRAILGLSDNENNGPDTFETVDDFKRKWAEINEG